ncbi:MAG TPA: hypothetical protein VIF83_01650 [Gemmatimonadaceae bacterium]
MVEETDVVGNRARYIGVGCVTAVAGFFSGGMIGVFVAKMVGSFRGCRPEPELPACDWHVYAAIGMLIGVATLPAIALWRLRSSDRPGAGGKPE